MTTIESHQDFATNMARIACIGLPVPGTETSRGRWERNRDWMEYDNLRLQRHLHEAMGYRPGMQEI